MNSWADSTKELAELRWDDPYKDPNIEISGWDHQKHSYKARSLELKTLALRPKLMLPRAIRPKAKYTHTIYSPPPQSSMNTAEDEKVENLILKLLEKNRKKFKKLKQNNTTKFSRRIVTRIPFLDYKLNLPRSLNMLKSPKKTKEREDRYRIGNESFNYRLTGTSLISSKYF
jgi:hypothetical protein